MFTSAKSGNISIIIKEIIFTFKMTKYNFEKEANEKSLCESFLKIYNEIHNTNTQFVRSGNASLKEVDCICSGGFNIEVSAAYANPYQAEKINSYRRGFETKKSPTFLLSAETSLEKIVCAKLHKLNLGNYSGTRGNIYLLVEIPTQLYTDKDILGMIENHTPFKEDGFFDKFFKEIWLIWLSDNRTYTISQLE